MDLGEMSWLRLAMLAACSIFQRVEIAIVLRGTLLVVSADDFTDARHTQLAGAHNGSGFLIFL